MRPTPLRSLILGLAATLLALAPPDASAQRWPFLGEAATADAGRGKGQVTPVRVFSLSGPAYESASPFSLFGGDHEIVFPELIAAIERESARPEVKVLLFRFGDTGLTLAQLEELSQAMRRASARKKRVVAHLDTATGATMLAASAADELVLSPEGTVMLTGLHAEVAFYKDLLAALGVEVDIESLGRYKSAPESMTRSTISDAAREQLEALLDSLYDTLADGIAAHRALPRSQIDALIDTGIFTGDEAKKRHLVDRLAYWRDLLDELGQRDGDKSLAYPVIEEAPDLGSFFSILELLTESDAPPDTGRPRIAMLVAEGPIVSGRDPGDLMSSQRLIASEDLIAALDEIDEDPAVKAIVLRVDSPGGSALASDLIWRELTRVGERLPIVVSMGSVAASGGYYIASAGKRIFAERSTITGSIGVFGGKLVLGGLYDKLGVHTVVINRGRRAGLMSSLSRFSDGEREVFRANMQHTYDTFINRVGAGRGMSYDAVHRVAQGRVWSGAEAKEMGLVDTIGGLHDALGEAARLAHLKLAQVDVVRYPKERSLIELLSDSPHQLAAPPLRLDQLLSGLPRPLLRRATELTALLHHLFTRERSLVMMPWVIDLR